jgi:hypothetical protein
VQGNAVEANLAMPVFGGAVCTENFIRIDWLKESPNVSA